MVAQQPDQAATMQPQQQGPQADQLQQQQLQQQPQLQQQQQVAGVAAGAGAAAAVNGGMQMGIGGQVAQQPVAPVAPAAAPVGAAALPPAAGSMMVMPADYINNLLARPVVSILNYIVNFWLAIIKTNL
jgi:hypothetical protein